jgi:hypothetical protein
VVWNNIAYALSEQNVQLERASQYSDAAINSIETQLRDVNLDNLRLQDIFTANLLYNVWDTKGWVEYKRGNLDEGERYIRAAWEANGNGNIAQHLGEIAEKRGNKDEAIRYYVFALTGVSPSPEARDRLTALGVTSDVDSRVEEARAELQAQRTHKLIGTGKGTGDFFVLASPAKNDQVKFVNGDAEVRKLGDAVKSASLDITFPEASSVRALRRGTVTCGTTPPPALAKGKAAKKGNGKSASEKGDKAAGDTSEPVAKPQLIPGPCSVELLPADAVRSVD